MTEPAKAQVRSADTERSHKREKWQHRCEARHDLLYGIVPPHDERATRYAVGLASVLVDATSQTLLTASPVVIPSAIPGEESVVQPSLEAGPFWGATQSRRTRAHSWPRTGTRREAVDVMLVF